MTLVSINAIDLVLAVAAAKQGAGEQPPGSNHGPYVERVIKRGGGTPGDPWCADEVADVGYCALGDHWPLPLTGSCSDLGRFAEAHKILFRTPARGDVWLKWYDSKGKYAHAGIVVGVIDAKRVMVSAGNTTRPGGKDAGTTREGWLNWTQPEPIGPRDGFVRWPLLLPATILVG